MVSVTNRWANFGSGNSSWPYPEWAGHWITIDDSRRSRRQLTMSSLVILGASGFLGRALISAVPRPLRVKAVARHIPPDAELQQVQQEGITWIEADLVISASLYDVLHPGDIIDHKTSATKVTEQVRSPAALKCNGFEQAGQRKTS